MEPEYLAVLKRNDHCPRYVASEHYSMLAIYKVVAIRDFRARTHNEYFAHKRSSRNDGHRSKRLFMEKVPCGNEGGLHLNTIHYQGLRSSSSKNLVAISENLP